MAIQRLTITQYDGSEITVTPNLGDTLAFERTLKQNPRLGGVRDNLLMAAPFRAWAAAKRAGLLTQTWEEFTTGPEAVLGVTEPDEENAIAEEGDELGLGGTTIQHTI